MKKISSRKTLNVTRETLRVLASAGLTAVRGGLPTDPTDPGGGGTRPTIGSNYVPDTCTTTK